MQRTDDEVVVLPTPPFPPTNRNFSPLSSTRDTAVMLLYPCARTEQLLSTMNGTAEPGLRPFAEAPTLLHTQRAARATSSHRSLSERTKRELYRGVPRARARVYVPWRARRTRHPCVECGQPRSPDSTFQWLQLYRSIRICGKFPYLDYLQYYS